MYCMTYVLQGHVYCTDISIAKSQSDWCLYTWVGFMYINVSMCIALTLCIRVKLTCCGGCGCFSRELLCMRDIYVYIWLTHIHTRPSTCTHSLLHTYTCAHTYVWEIHIYIGDIYIYTSTHPRTHTHTLTHTHAWCFRWREYIHRTCIHIHTNTHACTHTRTWCVGVVYIYLGYIRTYTLTCARAHTHTC